MLHQGETVNVRYSVKLARMGRDFLQNKTGVVTKIIISDGKLIGAYVDIKVNRKLRNYFIPANSIEWSHAAIRNQSLNLLKTTTL